MWYQCTKGHKWWVQGRAGAFPPSFRDGIQFESHGEPFALCLWCVKEHIGFVTPLEVTEELSGDEKVLLREEVG